MQEEYEAFKNVTIDTADQFIEVFVSEDSEIDDNAKLVFRRMFFSGMCFGMMQEFAISDEEATDFFKELVEKSEGISL